MLSYYRGNIHCYFLKHIFCAFYSYVTTTVSSSTVLSTSVKVLYDGSCAYTAKYQKQGSVTWVIYASLSPPCQIPWDPVCWLTYSLKRRGRRGPSEPGPPHRWRPQTPWGGCVASHLINDRYSVIHSPRMQDRSSCHVHNLEGSSISSIGIPVHDWLV